MFSTKPNFFVSSHLRMTRRLRRTVTKFLISGQPRTRVTRGFTRAATRASARQQPQPCTNKQDDNSRAPVLAGVKYPMHAVSHRQDGERAGGNRYQGAQGRHDIR